MDTNRPPAPRLLSCPRRAAATWARVYAKIVADLTALPGRRYKNQVPDTHVFCALITIADSVLNLPFPTKDPDAIPAGWPDEIDACLPMLRECYLADPCELETDPSDSAVICYAIRVALRALCFGDTGPRGIAETGIAK